MVIPTPENWHWAITPEDVKKIKAVDRDTIDRVYFANLEQFSKCAFLFCRKRGKRSFFEDCVQQIYLDLPNYDYTNVGTFWRGILKTFRRCCCNPFRVVSLFATIGRNKDGDELTLIDVLGEDVFKALEEREDGERQAIRIISAQTALSDNERDFLTAVAFRCTPYRGLYNDEYKRLIA